MSGPRLSVVPADWPQWPQLEPLLRAAVERLELAAILAQLTLVLDAPAADERAWLQLGGQPPRRHVTIWLHPDQLLGERTGQSSVPAARDWELRPAPASAAVPEATDVCLPDAQRTLYQQLLLVRDLCDGTLQPRAIEPALSEAFQEAWLVTVDGRLQRACLPHLSAAQRRLRFLHVFAPAGVLTPCHWAIFNQLWDGMLPDQATVLNRIKRLPPLGWRRGG